MPSLSKKQFFVLATIIVIITVVILVMITREDIDKEVNNNQVVNNNNVNDLDENKEESKNNLQDIIDEVEIIENENKDEENQGNEEVSINTDAQDMILQQIKNRVEVVTDNNSQQIFTDMISPTPVQIETYLGINLSNIDSYIVRMNKDKFSSKLYMIFKPTQEYKEDAKASIKKFLLAYEGAWSKLNDEQYNLVKNRTAIEKNGYIIYIISTDNDIIMHEIRKYI